MTQNKRTPRQEKATDSARFSPARQPDNVDQLIRMFKMAPDGEKSDASSDVQQALLAETGTEQQCLNDVNADPASHDVMALFRDALSTKNGTALDNWEEIVRARICERFAPLGKVGAGVFLRLLREPGEFISQEELARSAGVRSRSLRVIKVYICRLRGALAEKGLLPNIIKTGRHSYSLQGDAVPAVAKLLI